MLASQSLEILFQESTHLNDTVGHALDLAQPLLVKLGIVQNSRGNTSTVDGRVRVQSADEDLQLGVDTLLLLGRGTDKRECANTLTVETLRLSAPHFLLGDSKILTMFLAKLWHRAML